MILDKENMFDVDVALTATRDSTNVIDLTKTGQNIGVGEELWVMFMVTTELDSAAEGATLQVALVTDDNPGLDSATILQDQVALITEALLVAGYQKFFRINPAVCERYLGVIYTVGTENFTGGKITCGIVKDIQANTIYPKNFVTA